MCGIIEPGMRHLDSCDVSFFLHMTYHCNTKDKATEEKSLTFCDAKFIFFLVYHLGGFVASFNSTYFVDSLFLFFF